MTDSAQEVDAILDWEPGNTDDTRIAKFAKFASDRAGHDLTGSYANLWRWSVDDIDGFWGAVWDFFGLPPRAPGAPVLAEERMPGAVWFPDATINYAEEVFRDREPEGVAIITLDESMEIRQTTWAELQAEVAAFTASLRRRGIEAEDRVVGYLPNRREALIALLGTVSIGATWAVCGLDYPAPAAISRLSQLEPRALITTTRHVLAGQERNREADVQELIAGLPTLEVVVLAEESGSLPETTIETVTWSDWVAEPAAFEPVPLAFDHPLWVLFSSGTTGTPKGIIHGHGGIVLEYFKNAGLGMDLGAGDRLFWYTSPSWMMWNFLMSCLVSGTTIVIYDGSPASPEPDQIFRVAALTGATAMGLSPAYLEGLRGKGIDISVNPELRYVGVTASVFGPETHSWFRDQIGDRVQIGSSSGGTDIASGFAGAAPNLPTWLGELSGPCLAVALDSFDEAGSSVQGKVGELVVTRPMPSMPVRFWSDADGSRYRDAYFDTYPGFWRHGDWITLTDRGSVIIHGRSDATLNRYGVRMGSGDIYGPVESMPEIAEALVLGVEQQSGDYWMPLFVVLAEGVTLDDELRDRIRQEIRAGASPRHVPDDVIEAPAIPHTRTGKKLEVPLKKLFQGASAHEVADVDAVDSPEALTWFVHYATRRKEARS